MAWELRTAVGGRAVGARTRRDLAEKAKNDWRQGTEMILPILLLFSLMVLAVCLIGASVGHVLIIWDLRRVVAGGLGG